MDRTQRTDTGLTRLADVLPATASGPPPTAPNGARVRRAPYRTVLDNLAAAGITPDCPRCGDGGFLRRDLMPEEPAFGMVQPCPCRSGVVETRRIERLTEAGLGSLPRAALNRTFGTFRLDKSRASRQAHDAVAGWAGGNGASWLLLHGSNGSGKSHLCYAATRRLIDRGEAGVYAIVPELLDRFRANVARQQAWERQRDSVPPPSFEQAFADVLLADWLILDDLGAEKATDWADERLYLLIDGRYRNDQPLLVATNCGPAALPGRIASRLRDAAQCRIVDTGDEDRRPQLGRKPANRGETPEK